MFSFICSTLHAIKLRQATFSAAAVLSVSLLFALPSPNAAELPAPLNSKAQTFSSGESQVELIELYTSEGCSSCPPADHWLGQLKKEPGLWRDFVPAAFHVGYWDQLGWADRFAQPKFQQRQRNYRTLGISSGVYTPGFFVAGFEWRQWFRGPRTIPNSTLIVGQLNATRHNKQLEVEFTPQAHQPNKQYRVSVALLADKITSPIGRGENQGKLLQHHFVVLDFQQATSDNLHWSFDLPIQQIKTKESAERYAVAVWLSEIDNPQALQATGGWLKN